MNLSFAKNRMTMNYKLWNLRGIPSFKEEYPDKKNDIFFSIEDFKEKDVYNPTTRNKLENYLKQSLCVIATTHKRINPYTGKHIFSFSFLTDGEVLFNESLFEFIKYNDFAIPTAWFKIIEQRDFIMPRMELRIDPMENGEIDIFQTVQETFDEEPTIKKAIIFF